MNNQDPRRGPAPGRINIETARKNPVTPKPNVVPTRLRIKKQEIRRTLFQTAWVLATNSSLTTLIEGKIYQGNLKHLCVPGLNCYSCPGALGACPLGSLQNQIINGNGLAKIPFYILGFLMITGAFLGRAVCGWLCPFGWFQDLLGKLKLPKFYPERKYPRADKMARMFKYVLLALFVVLLPFLGSLIPALNGPWFCKYVCPEGTIFAGWPLIVLNDSLRASLGLLFGWKSLLGIAIVIAALFIPRFFCRYICPLGAIYGFFNRISFFRLRFSKSRCINCSKCRQVCPMGVEMPQNTDSAECIRCGRCAAACPTTALLNGFTYPTALKKRPPQKGN